VAAGRYPGSGRAYILPTLRRPCAGPEPALGGRSAGAEGTLRIMINSRFLGKAKYWKSNTDRYYW
jgi:hypothetical protein